jgi:hypothetical protein
MSWEWKLMTFSAMFRAEVPGLSGGARTSSGGANRGNAVVVQKVNLPDDSCLAGGTSAGVEEDGQWWWG